MFGRKPKEAKSDGQQSGGEHKDGAQDADALMRLTLRTLDQSLAIKREAREKTARFVGSLRPFAKAR